MTTLRERRLEKEVRYLKNIISELQAQNLELLLERIPNSPVPTPEPIEPIQPPKPSQKLQKASKLGLRKIITPKTTVAVESSREPSVERLDQLFQRANPTVERVVEFERSSVTLLEEVKTATGIEEEDLDGDMYELAVDFNGPDFKSNYEAIMVESPVIQEIGSIPNRPQFAGKTLKPTQAQKGPVAKKRVREHKTADESIAKRPKEEHPPFDPSPIAWDYDVLKDLTIKQLNAVCKHRGISGYAVFKKKGELLEAIKNGTLGPHETVQEETETMEEVTCPLEQTSCEDDENVETEGMVLVQQH